MPLELHKGRNINVDYRQRTNLPPVHFRPWLQAFRDYAFGGHPFDADEIRAQIDAAEETPREAALRETEEAIGAVIYARQRPDPSPAVSRSSALPS